MPIHPSVEIPEALPAPAEPPFEATPIDVSFNAELAEVLPVPAITEQSHITSQWPPLESPPIINGRLFSETTNSDLPLPPKTEIIIGRSDADQGVFPDIDLGSQGSASNSVSRRHARLLAQAGQVFIDDLKSTNSTYLNQIRVEPGQPVLLKNGDEIRLGGITLVYFTN